MPPKATPGTLADPALAGKLDDAFGPEPAPAPLAVHLEQSELEQARQSLDAALAWFQMNLPRVTKGEIAKVQGETKTGKAFEYDYRYADLTDVSGAVLPLLGRLGLSWRTRPTLAHLEGDSGYRFVLQYELKHVSGQSIEGIWPLPDRADPQAVGSVITYARRYCLCAVTGLAPGGDDDGTAAKEASRRGETLDEASALSLPPRESEPLVAALEPQALTPLAQYGEMWKTVVTRRAAGKPSPVEHDGRLLSWSELFGFSLAQRIEVLSTPAACRAFFDEAKAAGGDAALPWTWEDQLPSTRLLARGNQIKAELAQRAQVVELAIASASTPEELSAASDLAEELGLLLPDKLEGFRLFVAERIAAIERQTPRREIEDVPLPEPDERDEHWAKVDAETDEQHAVEPAAGGAKSVMLMAQVWQGVPLAELSDEIDAAFMERGELTGDEHGSLHDVLANRPEPGPDRASVNFLAWQAETAPNEIALDELAKRIKALRSVRSDLLDARQARELLASVAARRAALQELDGKRYR
jgi:hypothetical protein